MQDALVKWSIITVLELQEWKMMLTRIKLDVSNAMDVNKPGRSALARSADLVRVKSLLAQASVFHHQSGSFVRH